MIVTDSQRKTYDYFSRYANLKTLYNTKDSKRYYELSKHLNKDITQWVNHIVTQIDTLDSLALQYYGNPLFWWIIADINGIIDPFKLRVGSTLIIPYLNQVSF